MTDPRRVLVAGVGNVFLGDDGFGVEVLRRMEGRPYPVGVDVVDFGIRGFDLAYALLEDYAAAILVDAVPRRGEPGTLYTMEIERRHWQAASDGESAPLEGHSMDPGRVLRLVQRLGGEPPRLFLVACEPLSLDPDGTGVMGLTEPVAASIAGAVDMVESLLREILSGTGVAERVPSMAHEA
ncbi:MAG: hydrogenase maturation protease [Candidatus Limnocylindria bacterium]